MRNADLTHDLYWNSDDFQTFKQEALDEVMHVIKAYGLTFEESTKMLYDPSERPLCEIVLDHSNTLANKLWRDLCSYPSDKKRRPSMDLKADELLMGKEEHLKAKSSDGIKFKELIWVVNWKSSTQPELIKKSNSQ